MNKKKDLDDNAKRVIKEASGLGITQNDIARLIGVAPSTFKNWIATDEEIKELVETGRAIAKRKVARRLMEIIESDRKDSAAAIFFYLKCQCGWRETDKASTQEMREVKIYLPSKDINEANEIKETL